MEPFLKFDAQEMSEQAGKISFTNHLQWTDAFPFVFNTQLTAYKVKRVQKSFQPRSFQNN